MQYSEIEGNLVSMALSGDFEVITHGCNCFCTMGAGVALDMNFVFHCNNAELYKLEALKHKGNFNKLGCIEARTYDLGKIGSIEVINSYTQYYYGRSGYTHGRYKIPLDYDALTLCLRKINQRYAGKVIGLPKIGCSHGGGDWSKVSEIIKTELKDMAEVIVVIKNQ